MTKHNIINHNHNTTEAKLNINITKYKHNETMLIAYPLFICHLKFKPYMKAKQRKQRQPKHNKPQYTYEVNGMSTKNNTNKGIRFSRMLAYTYSRMLAYSLFFIPFLLTHCHPRNHSLPPLKNETNFHKAKT